MHIRRRILYPHDQGHVAILQDFYHKLYTGIAIDTSQIPTRNWKLCTQRFSLFDRQLTLTDSFDPFLERNSNTALSILSFKLLLQGNILEIVKTKEMCFAKRNA